MPQNLYAHSLPNEPATRWEMLSKHSKAVGARAASFASAFGWGEAARLAGQLHDVGKVAAEVQTYLRGAGPSVDHSTAGARIAQAQLPPPIGRMLAFAIAGHHAGLADADSLRRRLDGSLYSISHYDGWEDAVGSLPSISELRPPPTFKLGGHKGFSQAFLTRMLFSCLVDADFLETERFYAEAKKEPIERGGYADLGVLRDQLKVHMAKKGVQAPSVLNTLRAEVLAHAIAKAALPPGLFTLTVPTGGGKTLASLSFALEHALRHGLRRVIYVIPFTSIIEQTTQVFREALDTKDDVLEHHATFDWERAEDLRRADDEGPDGLAKLRRAAENWDAPIVVTTAVQFFESLFANRPSRCRKLHNIAGSVVILDEVQTLPVHLLLPCMAALDELARNYRTSAVLCTATQPALRKIDHAILDVKREPIGFDLGDERELAPDPERLYQALKRVAVERLQEPILDETISARFAEEPQMLCIVNTRQHAQDLFATIRSLPGAVHLTTLMCPRHRRMVLAELRIRLKNGDPVRLVATSLIEAGVDIDFPEVWRAVAGIESIAQAAGRCNREGRGPLGRVVVFEPAETKPPREIAIRWQATEAVFRKQNDPLGLEAVRDYFKELYWQKGAAERALDSARVGEHRGILPAIAERAAELDFPFASIAEAFQLIDDNMAPVVVPWRSDPSDRDAERLLARIAAQDRPFGSDLRRLQQYIVPIPKDARDAWLATGVLRPVHPSLGDAMLRFEDLAHYDPHIGVRLGEQFRRDSSSNVI